MNAEFPQAHQEAISQWPILFSEITWDYQFPLVLHGVELLIHTNNRELLQELKEFFPVQWQEPIGQSINIFWKHPPDDKHWDSQVNPNCFFQGDFVSQRDFLCRKKSRTDYQLLAFEKIDDGFFNFLRYLIPLHLLEQKKVLFHSSCVVDANGEAHLFFGPSGAGKTTLTKLCGDKGALVLGDDMNILNCSQARVSVEGGAVGQRFFNHKNFGKSFPIKNAYWIKKGSENNHFRLTAGRKQILLSSFANFFWDQLTPLEYVLVFNLASDINRKLNLFQLTFKNDHEVWNYVRSIQ